ncbi:ribosomal protein subunit L8 [Schizosaccharomyces octosporus yFS286]|uniref:Ribosomal protein subunit L8 n=1 Tax=Schizosaccharomyces octosporus (strain yFS286) TaxID=483514 RepID=S9RB27_SCHOY|nr:ribosomal protein subunit L8 [Schizosaccharomyces octosporus yFS286]EPX75345.1 ribosomal protein subunit L8 [Schizosaccharomyces octosporus yFS286]
MTKTVNFRKLGRPSAHRQSLLRSLVTSLVKHENIQTTWAKAKEAQKHAEHLITMAKKASPKNNRRDLAQGMIFEPKSTLKKVFEVLLPRYSQRRCGYTRVLRLPPRYGDNAPQAILEWVDGSKDTRFHMTAKAVGVALAHNRDLHPMTQVNMEKVLMFRKNGRQEFDQLVEKAKQEELTRLQEEYKSEKEIEEKPWKRGDRVPLPKYV